MINVKQTVNFAQLSKDKDKLLNLTQNEVVELVASAGLFYLTSAEHYLTLQAELAYLKSKVTRVEQEIVDISHPAIKQELEEKLKKYQHLLEPTKSPEVGYYFGCWERSGHGLHSSETGGLGISTLEAQKKLPKDLRLPDGLLPNSAPQSKIGLHQFKDGYTLIDMGDYTVDKRGGSHAVFFIKGEYSVEEMMDLFRQKFPRITKRIEAAKPFYQD